MAGPTDELSTLREHLERYRGVTLQTLDMVSEEKLRWYPTQSQFSFAEQFVHIAQVEDFYAHGLLSGDWDKSRLELPKERQTHETLRRKLEETRKFTMAKLDALDAARLNMIVSVPDVSVEWPLRSWLWYMVEHEIHHKAQLSVYMRQVDMTPPFFAFVLPSGVRPDIS